MRQTLISRKDSVVITTVEIISELGIQGLTSKEIAKREKISEGTLFSHFKNMNEIILAVLKYHTELDASIIETVEKKNLSSIEAIRLFASIYSENYENYPESTCLINISGMLLHQGELVKKEAEIIDKRIIYFRILMEKAQESDNLNPVIDSRILTDLMIGSFLAIVYRWRKSDYKFKFKEQVLSTLDVFLEAFKKY
ncbi:TetR/AcrR family transcriptional regulator [Clostridium estertheticum]|uniref:TetR/AcrR family transcriptional regulator n=1 Tax=Clostridium estertheticum TaxID=238834 RepID=UPI001C0DDAE6|nr:TetR/AcrR family transcriptional regulator [Clostridium estertheticum]MBU3074748.1 TetR/AcrR family transcriptional regulator [Clostridium estertheticum]MBU3164963.1 TetR/AcrR family transcriptional regulator [Clostridium estertheticum]MBU3173897.1 TetR/AcrR family transcriptional regulator [Clostridium estertheticum]